MNEISDGIFFHAVIQGRDITVVLPPQITPALSGLPKAVATTFIGRDTYLEELLQGLAPDNGGWPQLAGPVAAVAGLAGVGKTELVVQTAFRALKQPGWFPGGVLFVDLFGYDPERRLSPERALDSLLNALGVPGEHIPADLQDRTRLYRSVLAAFAEKGRRILVVIDNASTTEQVRLLLPTDGVTAALLTSRHFLDVDARRYDLAVLDEQASTELLRRALQQACGVRDTRVSDEPEAAAAIARLCAGLPLALRIAAALLADTPTRPLSSLAQDLEAEHSRLDELCREDRAVRAAFDLSYQHLDDDHASFFRLLSLNPGSDLSTESAAHLTDADQRQVSRVLQDLKRAHLVELGHTWGRWRLHDLVRLYADEQGGLHSDADQRGTARARLFGYYQNTASAADSHLKTLPGTRSPRFPDRNGALAWLDAERRNLIEVAAAAPHLGLSETTTALAGSLARYLDYRRYFDDWIVVANAALTVFRERGDRKGEAAAAHDLGSALEKARQFEESINANRRAVTLCQQINDRRGEAMALNNLGLILETVGKLKDAIGSYSQAVTIAQEIGDRYLEAVALGNLGVGLRKLGRVEGSVDAHAQAATLFREIGDRMNEATAVHNLGTAFQAMGQLQKAIDAHTQAAAVYHDLDDRHGEAMAQNNLGIALRRDRRLQEAVDAHTQAAALYGEAGDRYSEAMALVNLGLGLEVMGRLQEAIDTHARAAVISHETGDASSEASAVRCLGVALQSAGMLKEAVDAYTQVAALYRESGDRQEEEKALRAAAILHNERWLRARFVPTLLSSGVKGAQVP
ncbi:tetratricopeptide repeat protein [Streptomyces sp. NBC_00873]|uniref:tetratricopeptide repeat protein n=1 Tax=unclassified Streptomyces TaxID=2593676 RepID=UPI0038699F5E|nr:tetratricopeptide repeat protein [Streptomyces sp. NBC_00873]WTA43852.1 tetratricopeptide repeat protein [Streptomyces sp. NBC_00842]